MKIIVTGSLGHVSKPLTKELIKQGHSVTVISRKTEKQNDIEVLGAAAAFGSMDDAGFLASVFTGADAVYGMLSPGNFSRFADSDYTVEDVFMNADKMANSYLQAIQQSGVKHVVYLSSIGAHTNKGNGLLSFHYNAEHILNQLPSDVSITFIRPVGFYYTLLNHINAIITQGVIASNTGGEDKAILVSEIDIASAVAEELTSTTVGRNIRYVASDELTCNEVARILDAAIGKPDLKWITISDEQQLNGLMSAGMMNASFAKSFVEMNAFIHSRKVYEDYYLRKLILGKVKMTDFAKEFAAVYRKAIQTDNLPQRH